MTRNPLRLESTGRFRAGILLIAVGGGASSYCSIYDESLLLRDSGGVVGSGGAPSATGGGLPNTDGSATGGAAGAAMDGSAGMASGGAAGTSTGGSDGEAPCGRNQKRCNGACVERTPQNGCNGTACTPCPGPAPAYGLLTCNPMGECAFDCLSGYTISGNGCVSSMDGGGSGGMGDGGVVRCGSTNCVACPPPHITCCDRTTGNSCLCAPPDNVSTLCRAAAMDGSAGMASGGATGTSTGGNGGEAPCGTNQKRCNGACVERTPLNGCNGTACTPCPGPAPAYGLLTCNPMGECAFDCLPGYTISGNGCVPSTGTGGSGGMGDGGTVTCGTTNCVACPPPHITCCDRTTGNSCLCAPPDNVSTLCR